MSEQDDTKNLVRATTAKDIRKMIEHLADDDILLIQGYEGGFDAVTGLEEKEGVVFKPGAFDWEGEFDESSTSPRPGMQWVSDHQGEIPVGKVYVLMGRRGGSAYPRATGTRGADDPDGS
ncbi:hypothetical protein HNP46_006070 [Pseudomonas nitritireducens]|uniref:Uncharacterized protein n=1 Tax=Pseudomonas nitroreducens TaxID=46680 RepID=A0A7W7KRC8_PSENT|nr:hypothetical protein [Pseudomonas nitritireducens]MBB4867159.1 hypothetical protein [Pseudomonas nitritireducens]